MKAISGDIRRYFYRLDRGRRYIIENGSYPIDVSADKMLSGDRL